MTLEIKFQKFHNDTCYSATRSRGYNHWWNWAGRWNFWNWNVFGTVEVELLKNFGTVEVELLQFFG